MPDSSRRDDNPDETLLEFEEPTLEVPPSPESPTSVDGLCFDESMAATLAKYSVLEALFRLVTRNYRFHEFVRELLIVIMKAVKCEAGSVLEVDQKKKCLFFRAVVGQSSDSIANFTVPLGQGLAGHVAESRLPIRVDNVAENKMHLKAIQEAVGFKTNNLVALPIVVRGQVYGVLELLNRIGEPGFTEADVELLTYLCEMIAKAIEIRLMIGWSAKATRGGKAPSSGNPDNGEKAA